MQVEQKQIAKEIRNPAEGPSCPEVADGELLQSQAKPLTAGHLAELDSLKMEEESIEMERTVQMLEKTAV